MAKRTAISFFLVLREESRLQMVYIACEEVLGSLLWAWVERVCFASLIKSSCCNLTRLSIEYSVMILSADEFR